MGGGGRECVMPHERLSSRGGGGGAPVLKRR